jgi:hypothetical protein
MGSPGQPHTAAASSRRAARRYGRLPGAALAGAWLCAAAASAQAREPAPPPSPASAYRVFASVGGGIGEHELDCAERQPCRRSAGAARLTLGLALVPGLVLEGMALDFGRTEWRRGAVRVQERPRLLGLGLMAPLDLGPQLGVELRGGMARVQTRRDRIVTQGAQGQTLTTAQFYLGAALVLQLSPNAGLHLGLDASQADLEPGPARVSAATAGLTLRF